MADTGAQPLTMKHNKKLLPFLIWVGGLWAQTQNFIPGDLAHHQPHNHFPALTNLYGCSNYFQTLAVTGIFPLPMNNIPGYLPIFIVGWDIRGG
jgi:hypothetical protein